MRADLMLAEEKRTTNQCKRLGELPAVWTDWQQATWCPDCEMVRRRPNRSLLLLAQQLDDLRPA